MHDPFLALVVLDLGNLLGEYGIMIELATFSTGGNRKADLRDATDNQIEQTAKRRLIGKDLSVLIEPMLIPIAKQIVLAADGEVQRNSGPNSHTHCLSRMMILGSTIDSTVTLTPPSPKS